MTKVYLCTNWLKDTNRKLQQNSMPSSVAQSQRIQPPNTAGPKAQGTLLRGNRKIVRAREPGTSLWACVFY